MGGVCFSQCGCFRPRGRVRRCPWAQAKGLDCSGFQLDRDESTTHTVYETCMACLSRNGDKTKKKRSR